MKSTYAKINTPNAYINALRNVKEEKIMIHINMIYIKDSYKNDSFKMSHTYESFNDVIISKVLFTVINASVFTIFNCNHPYLQPYFTKYLLSIAKISTNQRAFNKLK